MNFLLILVGIYAYFVLGNLVNSWFNKLYENVDDCEIERVIGCLGFPALLILIIGKYCSKLRLPKFNIPFTPKKAADFLCKIDLSKLVKYRIRIEPKTEPEKRAVSPEKPDCIEYGSDNCIMCNMYNYCYPERSK